jgi:hypothetical protein
MVVPILVCFISFIMRHFSNLFILTMLFGLFSCAGNKKEDIVFDEFKSQIESKGMKIDSVDELGLIYISKGEQTSRISLDNLRKDYERDKDKKLISDFVQVLLSYSVELPKEWMDVKEDIYISLFPSDFDFKDFLHEPVTDEISKVYVVNYEDKLSWITKDDIAKWGITEAELNSQAEKNADDLLEQATISFDTIENRKLGLIETEEVTLKGALLFAPTMKEKVASDFGFPFYAVIPVRDFCYLFSVQDFDFFSERIGKVVVHEYQKSSYPITTEILKFTDNGVEVVGKYSID